MPGEGPVPAAGRKSTADQIRRRFDADVERFSNLETGQSASWRETQWPFHHDR